MGQTSGKQLETFVSQGDDSVWSVIGAESAEEESITIFEHISEKEEPELIAIAVNNGLRHVKVLRHPGIVKFQWDQLDNLCVSIITECVHPVNTNLSELNPNEICLGLYQIAQVLEFLHNKCEIAHGNIHLGAVFKTPNKCNWKLANFEHAGNASYISSKYLSDSLELRSARSVAPEDVSMENVCPFSRDIFAFGNLVHDVLSNLSENQASKIGVADFLKRSKSKFCHTNPESRPKISVVLKDKFFRQNGLVKMVNFLTEITLKSNLEKKVFFRDFQSSLQTLDTSTIARTLLDLLFSRVIIVEPLMSNVLADLLKQKASGGGVFDEDDYHRFILPNIVKMFADRDYRVRLTILNHLDSIIRYVPDELMEEAILPQLRQGLNDSNNDLVKITINALGRVAAKYSRSVLGGPRTSIFTDTVKMRERLRGGNATTTNITQRQRRMSNADDQDDEVEDEEEEEEKEDEDGHEDDDEDEEEQDWDDDSWGASPATTKAKASSTTTTTTSSTTSVAASKAHGSDGEQDDDTHTPPKAVTPKKRLGPLKKKLKSVTPPLPFDSTQDDSNNSNTTTTNNNNNNNNDDDDDKAKAKINNDNDDDDDDDDSDWSDDAWGNNDKAKQGNDNASLDNDDDNDNNDNDNNNNDIDASDNDDDDNTTTNTNNNNDTNTTSVPANDLKNETTSEEDVSKPPPKKKKGFSLTGKAKVIKKLNSTDDPKSKSPTVQKQKQTKPKPTPEKKSPVPPDPEEFFTDFASPLISKNDDNDNYNNSDNNNNNNNNVNDVNTSTDTTKSKTTATPQSGSQPQSQPQPHGDDDGDNNGGGDGVRVRTTSSRIGAIPVEDDDDDDDGAGWGNDDDDDDDDDDNINTNDYNNDNDDDTNNDTNDNTEDKEDNNNDDNDNEEDDEAML